MSLSWTLIEWNKLTTCYDSLRYEELNKPTMTYLDLLHQLHELSKDELQQTVQIYDKDCEEYIPTDTPLCNNEGKLFLQI